MKRPPGKYLLLSLILLFSVSTTNLAASGFIGIGSGASVYKASNDEESKTKRRIPLILEYEYSPEYRDLLMFNAAVHYLPEINNDHAGDLILFSAGIKYVPRFYFFRSNITESTFKENSCLGFFLLPLSVLRDSLNNIFQLGIPSHPFTFFDYTVIKTDEKMYNTGFSAGAGITSGLIDIKLKYTQNIRYGSGFHRDLYLAGFDFTLHIPLQEKFIMEKPLVD